MGYSPSTLRRIISNPTVLSRHINRFLRRKRNAAPVINLMTGIALLLLFGSSLAIIVFYSFLTQAPPGCRVPAHGQELR